MSRSFCGAGAGSVDSSVGGCPQSDGPVPLLRAGVGRCSHLHPRLRLLLRRRPSPPLALGTTHAARPRARSAPEDARGAPVSGSLHLVLLTPVSFPLTCRGGPWPSRFQCKHGGPESFPELHHSSQSHWSLCLVALPSPVLFSSEPLTPSETFLLTSVRALVSCLFLQESGIYVADYSALCA